MMQDILDSKLYNTILLLTILGEFAVPWILKRFYNGYDSKRMVMSVLGNPKSPVRRIYNLWLIWLGCFLIFTAVMYFGARKAEHPVLAVLLLLSIGVFAVGAGLLSGIFRVNEEKEIVTAASKIHGAGAAIGFMALLLFPLWSGILALRQGESGAGAVGILSFVLALAFFICFIMGDKERFQNTVLSYEGLWERMTLFCMYIPFMYEAVRVLFL